MDTKQLIAVLFAALLIASVIPAALADQGSDDTDTDTAAQYESNTTASADIGLGISGPGRMMESRRAREDRTPRGMMLGRNDTDNGTDDKGKLRNELRDQMKQRRDAMRDQMKQRHDAMRDLLKAHREEIESRIKIRLERLKNLRDDFQERRQGLRDARESTKEACSGDTQSTRCAEAKGTLVRGGHEFLGNAIEQILTHLANLKERIDANPYVDDATATAMNAQLQASATSITDLKASLEAANETDVNATKQIAADLRAAWQVARVRIRLADGLLWTARFGEFLEHVGTIETRLREARDKIAAKGTDVTDLDTALASFKAHIDAATTSYEDTRSIYVDGIADVTTDADASARIKAAKDGLDGARGELKDARDDVRAIVRLIRDADKDVLAQTAAAIGADAQASATVEDTATVDDDVGADSDTNDSGVAVDADAGVNA